MATHVNATTPKRLQEETAEQLVEWARQLRREARRARTAAREAADRAKRFVDDAERNRAFDIGGARLVAQAFRPA